MKPLFHIEASKQVYLRVLDFGPGVWAYSGI